MPFLVIGVTPSAHSDNLWNLIPALFQAGLSYLYIRQPDSKELRRQLDREALQPYQAQLILPFPVLNTGFRLHWKESARRQASPDSRAFSTSIHDLAHWPALAGRVETVFYSPLFPSISKPGYGPTLTLEEQANRIQALRRSSEKLPRLIGLGGIQRDNMARVQQAGFDGAAVLGALWESPDPAQAVRELVQQIA
ncbi:thiamine-phosphate pyrophosphorylase [Larkinella arboricola]|uniref:Thiamine-phosphate pyrophosphorylase n=1 Tax=Larkinella arboricola TaxID=643671 RepID=A0A327WMA9_LARAB|nr:thiamine phosphate synthase [Larkinella arboricola]RAJ92264.1 thiamine-phosphate pyrophosphorylase [Larkinella arboricola]